MKRKIEMKRMRFAYPVFVRRNCLLVCLVIAVVLMLLGGCTRSEVEDGEQIPDAADEVESFFSLNVRSNVSLVTRSLQMTTKGVQMGDSVQTRAVSPLDEAVEKQIKNLWVGQYAPSGNLVKEQYFASLTSQDEVVVRLVKSAGEQTVYLVANAGNLSGKADKADDLLKLELDYGSTTDGKPSESLCMMIGSWHGTVGSSGISGEVELTRLVAKISFSYSVGGTDFSFTPSLISLRNVPAKSCLGEPDGQLAGISYADYMEAAPSGTSATVYWYLPENKAGIVTGENAVGSEKLKTGKGVDNATYIELRGVAVQNNVTYQNVCFRLYPGSGTDNSMNDYMIKRNNYYALEIRFSGIDFSDERVTLEKDPEFENPDNLGAEKGASRLFQVTAQPGKPWSFVLPDWLSAKIGSVSVSPSCEVGFQGPARIEFIAATANPKEEERKVSILIDNKAVAVVQNPSSLNTGGAVSLEAVSGSQGQTTFTATQGLRWMAQLSSDQGNWLGWQGGAVFSGNESPGSELPLKVQALSSNPSAASRSGKITIKGGSATDGNYNGLTREVSVNQVGSVLTGSTVNVAAESAGGQSGSFSATRGLAWSAATATGWLSLADVSGSTSGNSQSLAFNVIQPNPSSSTRSGKITVRAGNEAGSAYPGPSGDIIVNQAGSTLSVAALSKEIVEAPSSGTLTTFTLTKGLSWSLGATSTNNWLSVTTPTSGTNITDAAQNINYSAVSNPDVSSRQGTIIVKAGNAVSGTDAGLTKTVTVTQRGSYLNTSADVTTLGPTAGGIGTYTMNGTSGLPYTFIAGFPEWLTVINGTASADGGTTNGLNQQLVYTTASANPNSTERSATIRVKAGNITSNDVTIKQSGSWLDASVNPLRLSGSINASGTYTMMGTSGLPYSFPTGFPGWLTITNGSASIYGGTTNGANQMLTFTANSANPNDTDRRATVTVKAGNMLKDVVITQEASTLILAQSSITLAPGIDNSGIFSMTGSNGLPYSFTSGFPGWVSVTNGTASIGGGTTNGSPQQLTFRTNSTNPNGTTRSATVTVKAGNISRSYTVGQAASSFSTSNANSTIASTANSVAYGSLSVTSGLSWTVSPASSNGISVSPTSGSGSATLTFTGAQNTGAYSRTGSFSVSVSGASPTRTATVTATQAGSSFSASSASSTIAYTANSLAYGSVSASTGLSWTISPASSNGISVSPTSGSGSATLTFTGTLNTGAARTGSFTVSVTGANPARTATVTATQAIGDFPAVLYGTLQVCKTEPDKKNWKDGTAYCENLNIEGKTGWRLPTMEEAEAMFKDHSDLERVTGFLPFPTERTMYWTSKVDKFNLPWVCRAPDGYALNPNQGYATNIRCVRNY